MLELHCCSGRPPKRQDIAKYVSLFVATGLLAPKAVIFTVTSRSGSDDLGINDLVLYFWAVMLPLIIIISFVY
jgi:hypothetical protein